MRGLVFYDNGLMTNTRGCVCGRARGGYHEYGREGTPSFFLFDLTTLMPWDAPLGPRDFPYMTYIVSVMVTSFTYFFDTHSFWDN